MLGCLRSAPRRLSPRARAVALPALLLGAVVIALATAQEGGPQEHQRSARATSTSATAGPRRPPVPAAQMARARRAASRFLAVYLRFAYGRARSSSVPAVAPSLGRQLARDGSRVPPVARSRRPRVLALIAVARTPRVVIAIALIEDGGITAYAVRVTVREGRLGWLVSGVDEG